MTITVYRFEDAAGADQMWTTQHAIEAQDYARRYGYKCFAVEYEYSDEELVWDFSEPDDGGPDTDTFGAPL